MNGRIDGWKSATLPKGPRAGTAEKSQPTARHQSPGRLASAIAPAIRSTGNRSHHRPHCRTTSQLVSTAFTAAIAVLTLRVCA